MYIIDYRVLYSGIPSHCLLCSICSHSEKRKEKIQGKKKTKKKYSQTSKYFKQQQYKRTSLDNGANNRSKRKPII